MTDDSASMRRFEVLGPLLVIAAAAALYAINLGDFFIGDDFDLIRSFYGKPPIYFLKLLFNNESGDAWVTWGIDPALGLGFLRPVKIWLLKLDFELWGTSALGYHVTSTAFYLACVWMVLLILRHFLPDRPALQCLGAFAAAIHPVFAELVPFITAREELVAACFSLAAFLAFVRFRQSGRPGWPFVVWYALALFTKESAITTIGLLAGYDLVYGKFPPRSRPELWALIRVYLPIVATLAVYFPLRFAAFGNFMGGDILPTDFSPTAFVEFQLLFFRWLVHPTLFALGDVPGIGWVVLVGLLALLAFAALRATNLDRERVRALILLGPLWYLCATAVLFGTYFATRRNLMPVLGLVLFGSLALDCALTAVTPRIRRIAPLAIGLGLAATLLPPAIRTSLDHHLAAQAVEEIRADFERRTGNLPDGCNVRVSGVPQWVIAPYFFGWALQTSLKLPFTESDVANRCRVVDPANRRLNRDQSPIPDKFDAVLRYDPQVWITPGLAQRKISRLDAAGRR
jgi:hypothetical protein